MAKSGIFYVVEMETDGWAWWSEYRNCWSRRPSSTNGTICKYDKETQTITTKPSYKEIWVEKERFLKAGVCTTRYHQKNGFPYSPWPSWDSSFYGRKFQYENEGLKILDEIIILEIEPYTLNPKFKNNHYKLEGYFENEFKSQYDYTPTKCFSGWTECYTLDLKNNFSSVETFIKEHIV